MVVAAVFALTSCDGAKTPEAAPSDGSGVGRFVNVHSPHVERDTMLLDTVSGRTWEKVTVSDAANQPSVWVPVSQMNEQKDWASLYNQHPKVAPKEVPVEGDPFASTPTKSN
jgi:hypothetical protein